MAKSWAAELNAGAVGRQPLIERMSRVADTVVLRELLARDATAVLALDARTLGDYPGDVATAHAPLTAEGATPSPTRRGWGAFDERGSLVGLTFAILEPHVVETDFTVVDAPWRGRGIGAAVKAASVLALLDEGRTRFRTGGDAGNAASLGANLALGYVVDEEWLTLAPAEGFGGGAGGNSGDGAPHPRWRDVGP
ncbi:acetyltransferase [Cnuibacter physcomitrellae]|uniref:GNAT family N-acetyltransferase n=1 Tax=Cnuibacter physcomitrellae TaxID=1619308 RepID=UPI0021758083|nr:acetyltransferase [Cnuibacter physcomitrellae]MCS5499428.1 acetyltransferase [Cnuibacter physcomitrellae]